MTDGQTVVGGRYQLQERVGRGGMAEVHRALDLRLGRPVAVKLLSAALAADPTAQTRFRREAQAAASLNDPTIASVYDTGEDTDPATGASVPYIVMELVEGSTLRRMLDNGPLPSDQALRITQSVLTALASSHDAGIIHRDIKPANVMVTPAGAVKVMDFGIARAVDDTSSHLTQTSAVIGTAQYLSPEQARGEEVDLRSDLYSVGCLLFELVTGRPPFVGESSISVAYQHVREAPILPSQLNPALPADLDAVVLRALAKDPADRYPSARAMRSDVEHLLAAPQEGAIPTRLAATAPAAAVLAPAESDATELVAPAVPVAGAAVPVADPDTEERRRSGLGRVLLLTTALLLVLGLGAFGLVRLLDPETTATASVAVPDVVGSTRAEADSRLRDADLVPEFREVHGKAGKTVDTVTRQRPKAGAAVTSGSAVTVEINVGPASAAVPDDLVGKDLDKVKDELGDAGFTNVQAEPLASSSDGVKSGEVVSLEPGEGEQAALDATIVVRYAADTDDGDDTGGAGTSGGGSGSGSGSSGGDDDEEQESTSSPAAPPSSAPTSTTSPSSPSSPGSAAPAPSGSAGSSGSAKPSETPAPAPAPSPTATATKKASTGAGGKPTEKPTNKPTENPTKKPKKP